MHIPDGFLDAKTFVTLDVAAAGLIGVATSRVRKALEERAVPLMAVLAAFIFAAQMLNFPVVGGTSGHFTGGALAALTLGPWPAVLIMTLVLVIQSLFFGDGGILALGANIFNMGFVAPFVAYGVYRVVRLVFRSNAGLYVGSFVASWLAVVAAATACALELSVSGLIPFSVSVPAMAGIHALIGIGEGIITAGAVAVLVASRVEVLKLKEVPGGVG